MCLGGTQKTTQTQKVEIPDYIKQAGQNVVSKAETLGETPFQAYEGSRVADFTGDQTQSFDAIRNLFETSPDVMDQSVQGVQDYMTAEGPRIETNILNEEGPLGSVEGYMNPYLDKVLQPVLERINENMLQQSNVLKARANSAGNFNSARHGILERDLWDTTQENIGDATNKAYAQSWDQAMGLRAGDVQRQGANAQLILDELKRKLTGAQALPQVTAANQGQQLNMINALLSSGTAQQEQAQSLEDFNFSEFMREQQDPYEKIAAMTSAISGTPYEKTVTGTTEKPDNSIMQLIGGVAGAALGNPALGAAAGKALFGA